MLAAAAYFGRRFRPPTSYSARVVEGLGSLVAVRRRFTTMTTLYGANPRDLIRDLQF